MNRRLLHFSALALRWLAIVFLLAIPVGSGIAWAVGLAKQEYVQVFGRYPSGETSVTYAVEYGSVRVDYTSRWADTTPPRGPLFDLPGLHVSRGFATGLYEDSGQAWFEISVRWWFLLLANIPPLLLAIRLAWPMLRRRAAPGRCPVCGYDLRATPDRCPECGAAPSATT